MRFADEFPVFLRDRRSTKLKKMKTIFYLDGDITARSDAIDGPKHHGERFASESSFAAIANYRSPASAKCADLAVNLDGVDLVEKESEPEAGAFPIQLDSHADKPTGESSNDSYDTPTTKVVPVNHVTDRVRDRDIR